ncbi:hypothetical protein CY34DRAFT_446290 [Suillus luteus UH-Slu-Lm8-n1]|uniref:Uncharacterized protein n=1 Tax=Suillus luteus UH-Slu-Lm8-n1 TaxID=930992 RepID=A0A0D0B0T8_9AGAM|nr:hypothetical protein CY34DRAFT_446290 [Suillus luteus UH-Slu-Lm8-n1]
MVHDFTLFRSIYHSACSGRRHLFFSAAVAHSSGDRPIYSSHAISVPRFTCLSIVTTHSAYLFTSWGRACICSFSTVQLYN